jgi:hypothetical protein
MRPARAERDEESEKGQERRAISHAAGTITSATGSGRLRGEVRRR